MDCLPASIPADVPGHYVSAALGKPPSQLLDRSSSHQRTADHHRQPHQSRRPLVATTAAAAEDMSGDSRQQQHAAVTFADLPPEVREMIWRYALPGSRVFNALVYASAGLRMQLLERASLRLPLAHVCFESREAVRRAGYRLAFRDEDEPGDPGVWFHPRRDVIERTIWGPGDFWGLR
ncbi:hypothetical protein F4820DRAFT_461790 [Hypoxylon rubiginosum]|uniref:Uncharacterized protein n=1 Tax=Hypoxylon rubiginosum TaxID=110542 RepID=A0ACB9YLR9_9PEZI|nr:hypothetical protein F4820DRAFT_461790 [Hypoxylon rubiginosum]